MIYIIDDDEIMRECIARACGVTKGVTKTRGFASAIDAMNAISAGELPSLIFLDVLLDGPDGFTLLHELVSYPDTASIPIVIVTSLPLAEQNLTSYGVVGILDKNRMTPQEIQHYVETYATH